MMRRVSERPEACRFQRTGILDWSGGVAMPGSWM